MVFASGGYTIMDFVKFGAPMQIWQTAVTLAVLFLEDYWMAVWVLSVIFAAAAFSLRRIKEACSSNEQGMPHVSSGEQSTMQLMERQGDTTDGECQLMPY